MKVLAFTKTAQTKATYTDYAGQKKTISLILITSISDGNNSLAPSSANSQTNIPVAHIVVISTKIQYTNMESHQGEHGISKYMLYQGGKSWIENMLGKN